MPVYLRKNVTFSPPSGEDLPSEDDDDYVLDPEQLVDVLPQPYRMIDKVLFGIFDDVWEVISVRENARIEESQRIRPPQYECAVQMEQYGNATAMTASIDGQVVFIGLPNGLAVIDALTQQTITSWEEDNAQITSMHAHLMGPGAHLLTTVDDMGVSRLFTYAAERVYLLKLMNEPEGGNKILASKCEASMEGDYVGVVLENSSSKETWLDVYKLPRDSWLKELEALHSLVAKQTEKRDHPPTPQDEEREPPIEYSDPSEVPITEAPDPNKSKETPVPDQLDSFGSPKPAGSPTPGDKSSHKFTPPTMVLKVKSPLPVAGCSTSNIFHASQKIDTGDVIGTGQNHILTQVHLNQREAVFNHLHDGLLKYLPRDDEEPEVVFEVNFHFLNAGRMSPQGLEQPINTGRPTTVAVWWSGGTHIMHYSLLKTAKDFEHKPDMVWPYTCKVTAATVTDDTALMAIGLENGTVVLWDRYLGIQRGVINISDCSVQTVKFLDPSICPQEEDHYPPYGTRTSLYLLVWCADSALYIVNGGAGRDPNPVCISAPAEDDTKIFTLVDPVGKIPDALLEILQDGTIQIQDVLECGVLCQMALPPAYELTTPWEPVCALGGQGQMLYVKGTKRDDPTDENSEDEAEHKPVDLNVKKMGSLFVYQLRSFPTLDDYWKKQREPVPYLYHSTQEKRVMALMKERIAQQGLRKTRMQERWELLRQEIDIIQQLRDTAKRKADGRPVYDYKLS